MFKYLLVAGYLLAVPPLLFIIPRLNKPASQWPSPWLLVAEAVGTVLIAVGWFGENNPVGGVINSSWLVLFGGLWLRARRKS